MKTTTSDGALRIMAAMEARIDQEAGDQARKEAKALDWLLRDELDKLGLPTMSTHSIVHHAQEARKKLLIEQLTDEAINNLMQATRPRANPIPDPQPVR